MNTCGKRELCGGCSENFYNGNNQFGIKECWNLKGARVVTRYKLHWWTAPTQAGAFTKVKTLSCHTETGRYAFYEKLPDVITTEERKRIEAKP